MKAETAARTLYSVVAIAVAVLMLAPVLSTLLNVSEGSWNAELSIESRYDLAGMDADSLGENITEAVGDKIGCRVIYGEYSDRVNSSNAYEIARNIKDSSAISAKVVDLDGNILKQQSIKYRNGICERTVTDIHLPDLISGLSSVKITMGFEGSGLEVPATSSTVSDGNVIHGDFTIPYAVKYAALALGCDQYIHVSVNYASSFKMNFNNVLDTAHPDYSFSVSGKYSDVISGIPKGDSVSGKIGDNVSFTSENGVYTMTSAAGAPSGALLKGLTPDGISIASGGLSVWISEETARGLSDVLKELEIRSGGFL